MAQVSTLAPRVAALALNCSGSHRTPLQALLEAVQRQQECANRPLVQECTKICELRTKEQADGVRVTVQGL